MNPINKIWLFEIRIDGGKQEARLWKVRFAKGSLRFEQKDFKMEGSLEKWKHSMALLSITGEGVVSKLYRKDDASIKKVTENEELLGSITPTESGEELVVSFLRKDAVGEFLNRLEKNHIYVLDKWIGKIGTFNKENYVAGFYEKEMNLAAIRQTPGRLNMVCNVIYYKLRLPVLLVFFFLLLGNFFLNTRYRKEYEAVQTELSMKQRSDKVQQENQKKKGRIQAEYQKIPDCSFALIADRIASYVPTNVSLHLLSVFPLESGGGSSIVNRQKGLKLRTGTVIVKGEVEIPGSITLLSQLLSSDKMFSKVEILSLERQKDSSMYSFELLINL